MPITMSQALSVCVSGSKTEGLMGLSETLVSMCVCGVVWGLVSGQPLIIQTKTAAFVMIEGGLFYVRMRPVLVLSACQVVLLLAVLLHS